MNKQIFASSQNKYREKGLLLACKLIKYEKLSIDEIKKILHFIYTLFNWNNVSLIYPIFKFTKLAHSFLQKEDHEEIFKKYIYEVLLSSEFIFYFDDLMKTHLKIVRNQKKENSHEKKDEQEESGTESEDTEDDKTLTHGKHLLTNKKLSKNKKNGQKENDQKLSNGNQKYAIGDCMVAVYNVLKIDDIFKDYSLEGTCKILSECIDNFIVYFQSIYGTEKSIKLFKYLLTIPYQIPKKSRKKEKYNFYCYFIQLSLLKSIHHIRDFTKISEIFIQRCSILMKIYNKCLNLLPRFPKNHLEEIPLYIFTEYSSILRVDHLDDTFLWLETFYHHLKLSNYQKMFFSSTGTDIKQLNQLIVFLLMHLNKFLSAEKKIIIQNQENSDDEFEVNEMDASHQKITMLLEFEIFHSLFSVIYQYYSKNSFLLNEIRTFNKLYQQLYENLPFLHSNIIVFSKAIQFLYTFSTLIDKNHQPLLQAIDQYLFNFEDNLQISYDNLERFEDQYTVCLRKIQFPLHTTFYVPPKLHTLRSDACLFFFFFHKFFLLTFYSRIKCSAGIWGNCSICLLFRNVLSAVSS